MASHSNSDTAPADTQASSEVFDETKSVDRKGQLRPDDAKLGDQTVPVDQALDGGRGERFGEKVAQDSAGRLGAREDTVERVADADRENTPKKPDQNEDAKDDKLDEALDDTFPASDPPPMRPGQD